MYLGWGDLPNPPVGRPWGGVCPTPPDADPPACRTPLPMTCDACWEANPPVDRMTDACKNITLPQTSFACGKNSESESPLYTTISN